MEAHAQMAPLQRVAERFKFAPNEQTRVGGVLLLIYQDENQVFFPMIVRPEYEGVHSGQVALPGGKKDDEDKDVIETALRETWEEIGVEVSREYVLGNLSQLYIPPSNFLVTPTIASIPYKPEFRPNTVEVAELLHIDLEDFIQNDKRKSGEVVARYMKAEVPYFDLHGKIVWGATAMILSEFLQILKEIDL